MPISDYAHWNEDAERVWWEEEGRHAGEPTHREYEDEMRDYEEERYNARLLETGDAELPTAEEVAHFVFDAVRGVNTSNLHSPNSPRGPRDGKWSITLTDEINGAWIDIHLTIDYDRSED